MNASARLHKPSGELSTVAQESLSPDVWALSACVREQGQGGSECDWEQLLRLASLHNVIPLLFAALSARPHDVPPALLDDVMRFRRKNALMCAFALRQRDDVLNLLHDAGIPCLVLKGAALAQTWYGDRTQRPFVDIDLFLPVHEISRARAVLLRAGYRESSNLRAAPHHETPLCLSRMPCNIELHRALTPLPLRQAPSFQDLFARSMAVESDSPLVRTLGPEDTLMHLCMHLLVHVVWTHGWQMRHLCDIERHVNAFEIDWHILQERVKPLGARHACGSALGLASILVGAAVPSEWIDEAGTLELLRYPMTGPYNDEHHFLAAFFAAAGRADLREARNLLLRAMVDWNQGGQLRLRDVQPRLVLGTVIKVLREGIMQPRHLQKQVRAWLPEAEKMSRREQLVADLLQSFDPGDESRNGSGDSTPRHSLT